MTAPRAGARRWRRAALAASLIALTASPAGAARPDSLRGVAAHLRSANRAIARLAERPAGPLASMYLAQADAQTTLGAGIARSIVAATHGGPSAARAATALGLLADHQTGEARTLSALLGGVPGQLQTRVADSISRATRGRGVVLGLLSALLPELPRRVRPHVAQIVAMESSEGAQVPVRLAELLGGGSLECAATGAVQQALIGATQAFQRGLANLARARALVPPPVHDRLRRVLDGVPALLRRIEQRLAPPTACAGATQPAAAGATAPPPALPAAVLLGGMTELVNAILGQLPPAPGASRTPAAGGAATHHPAATPIQRQRRATAAARARLCDTRSPRATRPKALEETEHPPCSESWPRSWPSAWGSGRRRRPSPTAPLPTASSRSRAAPPSARTS